MGKTQRVMANSRAEWALSSVQVSRLTPNGESRWFDNGAWLVARQKARMSSMQVRASSKFIVVSYLPVLREQ